MKLSRSCAVALSSLALAATAGLLIAGPLTPPGGPIASTMKTLAEVEPRIAINATNTPGDNDSVYRITQPGSYYLTSNIMGAAGKSGIEIAADNTTIDLSGFELIGAAGSLDGISAPGARRHLTIRNGTVRWWAGSGVNLAVLSNESSRIIGVIAANNGQDGIVLGSAGVVRECTAQDNGGHGIRVYYGTSVTACTALRNGSTGLFASSGSTFENCNARQNSFGIDGGTGGVVRGCSASDNDNTGISAGLGGLVAHCIATSNGGGIVVDHDGAVIHSTAQYNQGDGISANSRCVVLSNNCSNNGLDAGNNAGIFLLGTDNRVEGNNCSGGDYGIRAQNAGNILLRNTCAGATTNYSLVAGNMCYVVIAAAAPAINGSSGGAPLGTTEPNANFSY